MFERTGINVTLVGTVLLVAATVVLKDHDILVSKKVDSECRPVTSKLLGKKLLTGF